MRHVTGAFCDEVAVANGSRARNPCGLARWATLFHRVSKSGLTLGRLALIEYWLTRSPSGGSGFR